MITQSELKELVEYDANGFLIRRKSCRGNGNCAGKKIGNYNLKQLGARNARYIATKIKGKHYCVHKLIYLYHFGVFPKQLDHINGNSLDNRIENLRLACTYENLQNRKTFSNNTSGCKGVSWHKKQNKWFVYLNINNKRKNIGYFKDFEFAEFVAQEARSKYHGEFAKF